MIGERTPKIEDVIIGTGERLSSLILSVVLNSKGVESTNIDLSEIMPSGKFEEMDKEFLVTVKENLRKKAKQYRRYTGIDGIFWFRARRNHELGRQGLYGFYRRIGFMRRECGKSCRYGRKWTAFLRQTRERLDNAHVLESISPNEAAELTYYGSEVIHPLTMEQVMTAKIPIRIKNTSEIHMPGTVVDPECKSGEKKGRVTAVTGKTGINVINIRSNRMMLAYGFMRKIFDILAEHKIVIDLISTSEVNVSVTVDDKQQIESAVKKLGEHGDVVVESNLAILSLVGEGMKNSVGISAKLFRTLAEQGISIEMISQGGIRN